MAVAARGPNWALHQRDELIAHVDKGRPRLSPSQGKAEDPPVADERLLHIADLERDVIQPDKSRPSGGQGAHERLSSVGNQEVVCACPNGSQPLRGVQPNRRTQAASLSRICSNAGRSVRPDLAGRRKE